MLIKISHITSIKETPVYIGNLILFYYQNIYMICFMQPLESYAIGKDSREFKFNCQMKKQNLKQKLHFYANFFFFFFAPTKSFSFPWRNDRKKHNSGKTRLNTAFWVLHDTTNPLHEMVIMPIGGYTCQRFKFHVYRFNNCKEKQMQKN